MSDNQEQLEQHDMPIVALLEKPFHEMSVEEQQALVAELRERRTNATKTHHHRKTNAKVLKGGKRKPKVAIDLDALLQ